MSSSRRSSPVRFGLWSTASLPSHRRLRNRSGPVAPIRRRQRYPGGPPAPVAERQQPRSVHRPIIAAAFLPRYMPTGAAGQPPLSPRPSSWTCSTTAELDGTSTWRSGPRRTSPRVDPGWCGWRCRRSRGGSTPARRAACGRRGRWPGRGSSSARSPSTWVMQLPPLPAVAARSPIKRAGCHGPPSIATSTPGDRRRARPGHAPDDNVAGGDVGPRRAGR